MTVWKMERQRSSCIMRPAAPMKAPCAYTWLLTRATSPVEDSSSPGRSRIAFFASSRASRPSATPSRAPPSTREAKLFTLFQRSRPMPIAFWPRFLKNPFAVWVASRPVSAALVAVPVIQCQAEDAAPEIASPAHSAAPEAAADARPALSTTQSPVETAPSFTLPARSAAFSLAQSHAAPTLRVTRRHLSLTKPVNLPPMRPGSAGI